MSSATKGLGALYTSMHAKELNYTTYCMRWDIHNLLHPPWLTTALLKELCQTQMNQSHGCGILMALRLQCQPKPVPFLLAERPTWPTTGPNTNRPHITAKFGQNSSHHTRRCWTSTNTLTNDNDILMHVPHVLLQGCASTNAHKLTY